MKISLATLSSRGQIVLPAAICKKLGMKAGDKVAFIEAETGVRVVNSSTLTLEPAEKAFAAQRQKDDGQTTEAKI